MIFWNWGTTKNWYNLASAQFLSLSEITPAYCRIVEQLSDHDIKKHRADICLNGLNTGGLFLGCFLPQASLFENRLKFQKEMLRIFEGVGMG